MSLDEFAVDDFGYCLSHGIELKRFALVCFDAALGKLEN